MDVLEGLACIEYGETLGNYISNTKQKEFILESFPNIGPKTAESLLKRFKTLNNIFSAKSNQLYPILKSKTNNFINLLN